MPVCFIFYSERHKHNPNQVISLLFHCCFQCDCICLIAMVTASCTDVAASITLNLVYIFVFICYFFVPITEAHIFCDRKGSGSEGIE